MTCFFDLTEALVLEAAFRCLWTEDELATGNAPTRQSFIRYAAEQQAQTILERNAGVHEPAEELRLVRMEAS